MHTSIKQFSSVLKQEGTSRQERYMPALHESSLLLDDRKLQDLMLYIQQYSKNLLFVDTEKQQIDFKESWEAFFSNDPVLLIAGIAAADTAPVKQDYDHLNEVFQRDQSIGSFAELARYVLSRFTQLDRWYKLSPPDGMLYQDLHLYIASYLRREIEVVREMILYIYDHAADDLDEEGKTMVHNKHERAKNELEALAPAWKLDPKEKLTLREKIFRGDDQREKLVNASILLNKAFETVFYATEAITEKSARYFEESIHQKHNHKPHVALIITFLKLFGYEQQALNKIPQRLLNFYYRDVLRVREKGAVPDQAFIVMELARGFDNFLLKEGTRFSAGKDKRNNELVYATDKDMVLNRAQVTTLRTLFVAKNDRDEILNYYVDAINDLPGKVEKAPAGDTLPAKMFGEIKASALQRTGFAIASSQLYLAKGQRHVVLTIDTAGDIEPPELVRGNGPTDQFDTAIINILLTGDKGWISSTDIASGITINSLARSSNTTLVLDFTISIAQEQAIIAFDKKLHQGDFNTAFPVMKCMLIYPNENEAGNNSDQQLHQLHILHRLQVERASISVIVGSLQQKIRFDGVRDLVLENDEATLDNRKPFFPFTPVPKVSSSFYIGCKDLFYKPIQQLSINIEWLLPDNFRTYYKKYHPPYDSNKFSASLSYLDENRWTKYADVSVIDVNSGDPGFRTIKMNLEKFQHDTGTNAPDVVPTFDNVKQNGTLKLKLNYPDFGHGIYPQLITSSVMDKANSKSGNVDYYKLLKKRLHDDIFTINLPPDLQERRGSLKVMYDILENFKDDAQARSMLVNALSDTIGKFNDIEIITRPAAQSADPAEERGSRMVVHDQNFFEKTLLRFLRKVNIIRDDVHRDKDKEGVEDVVNDLEDDIYNVADFILPAKKELNNLIINEVNKSINQTVTNAVDRILEDRGETKVVNPDTVATILQEEFENARKVINDMIAKKIAISLSASEIPPPPYSPLVKNISLNYASTKDMSGADNDKLFHITATHGIVETSLWGKGDKEPVAGIATPISTNNMLPQLIQSRSGNTEVAMQAMLFIGIKELVAGQNLSLLFQVAEGTRNADHQPPPLWWYYLRENEWIPMKQENIISNSTHDLQTTGIIEYAIPTDADNRNSSFENSSPYWLCVAVQKDADAFPYLIDVKAQAIAVTFTDHLNNPQHMALPLEAQRIKTSIDELPPVKKIIQPVSSFNGRVGEKENEYYTRVSERLRHKSRAISNWDYETLVLEQFPSFYKVKCINNYYNGHFAVGHVTVVPIADLRNKNYAGSNILVPKTNYIDLKKVEAFLAYRASPFVKVHAINPRLEHIYIKCRVKFHTGVDKGFFLKQLNEDLVSFLTPWATDAGKISFSAKVYASSIINFVDKRPYVDFVMDLAMLQYTENDAGERQYVFNNNQLASLVETRLSSNHSILVSAPKHAIELIG